MALTKIMKKFLLLLLLLPFAVKAQDTLAIVSAPVDPATRQVTYTSIIEASGIKKDLIYSRVREWVALNFKSAQNVIQMDDKESGKIITKGLLPSYYTYRMLGSDRQWPYNLRFTLNIAIKDEKLRVQVSDFETEYPQSGFAVSTNLSANELILKLTEANRKIKVGKKVSGNERKLLATYQEMLLSQVEFGKNEAASIRKAVLEPANADF
jgi:hypothetical protein